MASNQQELEVIENWEEIEETDVLEKKFNNLISSNGNLNQPLKIILTGDDALRSQYVPPEPTTKILKRPSKDSQNSGDSRVYQPKKTRQQREQEYAQARLRILGEASPEKIEEKISIQKSGTSGSENVIRLPKGPDGTNGFTGHLSDIKGNTKILMFCIFFSAVGNVLSASANSLSFVFFSRIVCVIGSPIQILIRMIITDLSGPNDASNIFNRLGAMMGISFLGGTLMGGKLSEFQYGITYTYLLMSVHSLISLVLVGNLPVVNKSIKRKDVENHSIFKSMISTFGNLKRTALSSKYWDVFTIKAILDLSNMIMYSNNKMIMRDVIKHSELDQSYSIIIFSVFATTMNLSLSKIKTIFYPKDMGYVRIVQATACAGMGSCLLGITSSYWLYIICFEITDLSKILLESSLMEVLLLKITSNDKGMVLSSYDSIFSIAEIIVPVTSGIIADLIGPGVLLLTSGSLYFVANRVASKIIVKTV